MRLLSYALCLLYIASTAAHGEERGEDWWAERWDDLKPLYERLAATDSGKVVADYARQRDPDFLKHVLKGNVSITESTILRSYSVLDGEETINVEHSITLSGGLSRADALLDLAHELTHLGLRKVHNPYEINYSVSKFIKNGIEGVGGELDAFQMECKVAWELEAKEKGFPEHPLCKRYKGKDGNSFVFLREKARTDYYAVGAYFSDIEAWREKFPLLSGGEIHFISSYAKLPYPLALAKEYQDTKVAACQNNDRKSKMIAAQGTRAPASVSPQLVKEKKRLEEYKQKFCGK